MTHKWKGRLPKLPLSAALGLLKIVSARKALPNSSLRRLRRLSQGRKRFAWLLLCAPLALVIGIDLELRWGRQEQWQTYQFFSYGASLIESFCIWSVLLLAAARRRGRMRYLYAGIFLFFLTMSVGGQLYFFQQYNAYLNVDVSLFATQFVESVLNQLWADRANYLAVKLPVLLGGVLLLWLSKKFLRPGRRLGRLATLLGLPLLFAGFFIPTQHRQQQASSPDMLYLHALGGMLRTQLGFSSESHQLRPRLRESLPVPALKSEKVRRSIIFVLSESVRKDATCNGFSPDCRRTEATNQLFPERIAFEQMRALDSSTAISLAVLWSGLSPQATREELHTAPLLFDFARQAGYQTLYWTSQNMMFGNVRLWVKNLGVQSFFSATDIEPDADIDLGAHEAKFTERALGELDQLSDPFFLMIQLSNGHYPYLVDADGPQPFQPAAMSKAPEDNDQFFNYYQNAIYQQDQHLARLLKSIRTTKAGRDAIIIYTSDHGEAFREHYQMGHTFSVFDEEVLVPAWLDAPPGVLSQKERAALLKKRESFNVHPDITATILDLMGLWDLREIAPFRAKMRGTSLLSAEANPRALAMTNCAGVWSCAFENWGYIQGSRKLEARAWDSAYHCYDLKSDPKEKQDLGVEACAELASHAQATFGRLPGEGKQP